MKDETTMFNNCERQQKQKLLSQVKAIPHNVSHKFWRLGKMLAQVFYLMGKI